MRISTKGRYGLRALVDLAAHYQDRPVLLSEIAERQTLSKRYLERLFTQLRDNGILRSVRGASGGYMLNRKPNEISVTEILEALEGSLSPVECIVDSQLCCRTEQCVTHDLWTELSSTIREKLDSVSLEELKDKQLAYECENANMYYI
ncbi:MAG TPA: Rrf2 family transcriptional regulator [bacterium]|nr:Rrf2 family transcriptional regulator [bacterium]